MYSLRKNTVTNSPSRVKTPITSPSDDETSITSLKHAGTPITNPLDGSTLSTNPTDDPLQYESGFYDDSFIYQQEPLDDSPYHQHVNTFEMGEMLEENFI